MNAWVALLRGINVGGINIKSADLARAFTEHGYGGVKTVLATGNVLFESPVADAEALRAELERMLSERFGYEARVVLEPRARLADLAAAYPYAQSTSHHAYVVFTSVPEELGALLAAAAERGIEVDAPALGACAGPAALGEDQERVAPGDGVLFWACPRGSSTSTPFSALTSSARFKKALTTRNLNTVRKLLP